MLLLARTLFRSFLDDFVEWSQATLRFLSTLIEFFMSFLEKSRLGRLLVVAFGLVRILFARLFFASKTDRHQTNNLSLNVIRPSSFDTVKRGLPIVFRKCALDMKQGGRFVYWLKKSTLHRDSRILRLVIPLDNIENNNETRELIDSNDDDDVVVMDLPDFFASDRFIHLRTPPYSCSDFEALISLHANAIALLLQRVPLTRYTRIDVHFKSPYVRLPLRLALSSFSFSQVVLSGPELEMGNWFESPSYQPRNVLDRLRFVIHHATRFPIPYFTHPISSSSLFSCVRKNQWLDLTVSHPILTFLCISGRVRFQDRQPTKSEGYDEGIGESHEDLTNRHGSLSMFSPSSE